MATYTVDKVAYNGNTYNLQDAGALQTAGGTVTGPVTFNDTITTNDIQTSTINNVEVGNSPKFTDTVTTVTTTGDGNAVTSITASNGAITATKGSSFIDTAGTGLSKSGSTLNHSNSITSGTVGTSSNTSGVAIAVPYATYDAQGHITGKGTHTHTVTTATASANGVGRVAGGTNVSVTYSSGVATVNAPSNVSAFTNDAGYITESDIPEGAAAYTGTPSAVSTTAAKGESNGFARGDHVHNITGTTITDALGYTPYNSTNPNGYTSNIGTVTGVKINGTTKNPTSGVVDIGTVLTSYTETDPVYSASAAAGITSSDITNWNNKTSNTGTVTGVTAGTGLKVGTNTSGGTISTSGTINHSNSVTAKTTQGLYPITYDAQGHITGSGSAVTIPAASSTTPSMDGTASAGSGTTWARADHVHPSDSSKVDTVSSSSYDQATISNNEGAIDLYTEPQSGSTGSKTGITIDGEFTRVYNGDNNYFDATPSGFTTSYVSSSGKQFTSHVGPGTSNMAIYGESESDSWGSIDLAFNQNTGYANARLYARGAISSGNYPENEIRVTPTTTTIKNVVTPVDNGDAVPKSYVDGQDATKQATLVSGTNIKTINGTSLLGSGNITTPDTDNKVAQNNSTAANDFRVLLSHSVSDSSETAEANKSAGLRFMPSTNHLYVGSEGNDAYISVSPRVYVGTYNRYTQDGQTESSTSYGVGIGIDNALAYTSYLTTTGLVFQHWNASRPNGGVPSSTNYVASAGAVSHAHVLLRDYSGKDALTTESELTSARLSFTNSAGTTYIVTPTKIDKWDNYTDTKNTAGSTNTSSKIFLIGATSQAANPQTYSHDTAYVGTNGHLYSNSKQVVNLSDSQTISNKTLDDTNIISVGTVVNNPAITSSTTSVSQTTWGATTSTYTKAIGDFICRIWGPVVMLYIRFTTGATGGTGTTRIFFTPADNYKPVGLYYCQVNATTAPYAQVTNASFWFTSGGILQGRAVADTEYRISCMYLVNN